MKKRTSRTLAGVAALCTAALLAACSSGSSSSSSGQSAASGSNAPGTQSLTVGIPPVVELGNLFTAQSLGYFAAEGLSVKTVSMNGGATLVPALEAGSLQIAQSNIVSVLQAQQQNIGMKCFAAGFRSPSASSGAELSLVISAKDAGAISSPAGLAGKTIAVNTLDNSNQLVADVYLAQHGVSPSSVHFIALAYPDMPSALSSGRVAAAITDEPFTSIVQTQGSKVMAAAPDAAITANPVYACWVASASWLNSHKQVAAKFVAALDKADSYIAAHPGYVPSILPKYTSVTAALAKQVTLPEWTTTITADDVQPWAQAAAKYGITRSVVAPSSVLTNVTPAAG
jgi:NitT/TauT family transport system substrate-binding protein